MKTEKQLRNEIKQLTTQLLEKQQQIDKLEQKNLSQKLTFEGCLKNLRNTVRLLEAWAYGPAFRKAGHIWPHNTCDAPDYVKARHWIKLYDQEND